MESDLSDLSDGGWIDSVISGLPNRSLGAN